MNIFLTINIPDNSVLLKIITKEKDKSNEFTIG
jgi:hypothetical protein